MSCDHKFVDSNVCLKCGVSIGQLRAENRSELEALQAQRHPGQEYIDAQNHLSELAAKGGYAPLTHDEITLISYALGLATAQAMPRRRDRPRTEPELTHGLMHEACDLMLAQYLMANPGALPSETSVLELLTWSHQRMLREARSKKEGS